MQKCISFSTLDTHAYWLVELSPHCKLGTWFFFTNICPCLPAPLPAEIVVKISHMYHVIYLKRGRECNGDWKEHLLLCLRMTWCYGVIANSDNRDFSLLEAGNCQLEKEVDDKRYQHPPQTVFYQSLSSRMLSLGHNPHIWKKERLSPKSLLDKKEPSKQTS